MAYLKPADECECGTCKGFAAAPEGHYGGWICQCHCHNPTEREIATFMQEYDEGKHPLSEEMKAALERAKSKLFREIRQKLSK